ncbi:MAG: gluconate 2-dehydrogenase subunit 3 family protein [Gemmatimonadales bacterium]
MDRRDLLKTLGASAALPILAQTGCAKPEEAPVVVQGPEWKGPAGTPSDPDLVKPKVTWDKVLTPAELVTLGALCDVIIPADDKSPAASAVGVPDYINEWVSAPYDYQKNTLPKVRAGLTWMDTESGKRFKKPFAELADEQKTAICDDICYLPKAKPAFKTAAEFFDLIRDLSATAFYTTREGMQDIQYIGNMAQPKFDGPPPEVLKHLGLA